MKIIIKHSPDEGRKSRWVVDYNFNRQRVRKYFKTMDEAKDHANEVSHVLRRGDNPMDYEEAHRLSAGTGYSLLTLVRAGLEHLVSTANRPPQVPSSAAIPGENP